MLAACFFFSTARWGLGRWLRALALFCIYMWGFYLCYRLVKGGRGRGASKQFLLLGFFRKKKPPFFVRGGFFFWSLKVVNTVAARTLSLWGVAIPLLVLLPGLFLVKTIPGSLSVLQIVKMLLAV